MASFEEQLDLLVAFIQTGLPTATQIYQIEPPAYLFDPNDRNSWRSYFTLWEPGKSTPRRQEAQKVSDKVTELFSSLGHRSTVIERDSLDPSFVQVVPEGMWRQPSAAFVGTTLPTPDIAPQPVRQAIILTPAGRAPTATERETVAAIHEILYGEKITVAPGSRGKRRDLN